MLLGDRYVNINPTLPCFIPENSTNAQAIDLLERHGKTVNIDEATALITKYWPDMGSTQARPAVRSTAKPAAFAASSSSSKAAARTASTPGHGEFFYIQHKLSNDVLDVWGTQPNSQVVAYPRQANALSQHWQFIPSEENPGWYFLQTAMNPDLVMTFQNSQMPHPSIVADLRQPALLSRQLWSLVSTAEIGWWFIQSKSQTAEINTVNPNSYVPTVIGVMDEGGDTTVAVGTALDYLAFEPQAWGFMRLGNAR